MSSPCDHGRPSPCPSPCTRTDTRSASAAGGSAPSEPARAAPAVRGCLTRRRGSAAGRGSHPRRGRRRRGRPRPRGRLRRSRARLGDIGDMASRGGEPVKIALQWPQSSVPHRLSRCRSRHSSADIKFGCAGTSSMSRHRQIPASSPATSSQIAMNEKIPENLRRARTRQRPIQTPSKPPLASIPKHTTPLPYADRRLPTC